VSPSRKWSDLVVELTHQPVVYGQGLGPRVVELIDNRNLIAPDPKTGGRSAVRVCFTAARAERDVTTATEAIDRLTQTSE
jgi:hypothetical protein